MPRFNPTSVVAALLASGIILGAAPDGYTAGASPACAAKCLPKYTKHMSKLAGCVSKSLKKQDNGTSVEACAAKAAAKMGKAWHKAETSCAGQTCDAAYPTAAMACNLRYSGSNAEDEVTLLGTEADPPQGIIIYTCPIMISGCTF